MSEWAKDYFEIQKALDENQEIKNQILELVEEKPIHGKSIEGGERREEVREILTEFFKGGIDTDEVYSEVNSRLPRQESPYSQNNQTFAEGWEERLIRTQVSRFYNQAVLSTLEKRGDEKCFIPHSREEKSDSPCTQILAGNEVEVSMLLNRLKETYDNENYHNKPMIPDHPHCTHTVCPKDYES